MPAPPAAPPPARVAPVPVNPPPPLACPTIEQLIAEDDTWTLKDWFSCLLCPVAPRHSKGGGASRSKGSRLEPPSKPKSSPLEPPKKRQRTDDEAKSVEDVAALVGGKCELNTETGPVAVVYLPQLTEVLSQQGLEYVSRPDARVDIQTPLKDLDPALVKELDAGVLVLNEALQKSPNDRQGEKFTERLVAWVHALLAKVCRLVVGDFFEIDMTPTSVKAHIPDAEIWFGDSLRGILEAKKGVKGEGVVNAMQRFFEGRMTAEPAGRRFSVCALSELPGSPESGVQNLIAKALQAALSVPAGPGSKNNPFLLVFQDWGIFIPAVVWRLSSKPKSLPLGLVVDSVKRAAQLRKLPPPLISPFQPSSSYQPYLLVMGQATTLDTRFEVDKSSYILSLLAGGATPSAVFAAVSKSLGKSARQLMLQLGISSTQVQAASSVQSQAAMHMRGGAGGECSVSEAGTSVSDESMDEDGPPSDSQSGSSLTDTVTSMPSQDGSPHKYTETSDPLSLLQQLSLIPLALVYPDGDAFTHTLRRLTVEELATPSLRPADFFYYPPSAQSTPISLSATNQPDVITSRARVYRATIDSAGTTVVIVKVSVLDEDDSLYDVAHEGLMYERFGPQLKGVLPHFFGAFDANIFNHRSTVLILEDAGENFDDWAETSKAQRVAAYDCLEKLHSVGLAHGDFLPHNVVCDPHTGDVKLIDLGNASEHSCPGRDCEELVEARRDLALP